MKNNFSRERFISKLAAVLLIVAMLLSATGVAWANQDEAAARGNSLVKSGLQSWGLHEANTFIAGMPNTLQLASLPLKENNTWKIATGADLHAALAAATDGDIFELQNDLYMGADCGLAGHNHFDARADGIGSALRLVDQSDLTLTFTSATGGKATIYRVDHRRHLHILNCQDVTLVFENVVLDGNQTYVASIDSSADYSAEMQAARDATAADELVNSSRGGIMVYGSNNFSLEGAEVRNCFGGLINDHTRADKALLGLESTLASSGDSNGGGITIIGSSNYLLADCTITENVSGCIGGGVHTLSAGGTIRNCHINNNGSIRPTPRAEGGGLVISGTNSSDTLIVDSTVSHNLAKGHSAATNDYSDNGGGIYFSTYGYAALTLRDTIVSNNQASLGGGIVMVGDDLQLAGATQINANKAVNTNTDGNVNAIGGGIYMQGGGAISSASGELNIDNNSAWAENGHVQGGGLYIRGSNFDLEHATASISGNIADAEDGYYSQGGGVYLLLENNEAAILGKNVTLANNTATTSGGGGIYNYSYNNSGTVTLACTISGNVAQSGGGVYNSIGANGTGEIRLDAATIHDNKATFGGGVYTTVNGAGKVAFTGAVIRENAAEPPAGQPTTLTAGGGAYVRIGATTGEVTFQNTELTGNSATYGGGLYIPSSSLAATTLRDCAITNNLAQRNATTTDEGSGGGIHAAPELLICGEVSFTGNVAEYGGFYIPEDAAYDALKSLHDQNITSTVSLSAPFSLEKGHYAYNNYDINFSHTAPYVVSYYEGVADGSVTGMPSPNPVTGLQKDELFPVSATAPARSGYTFKGWQTADVSQGAVDTYQPNSSFTMPDQDVTLTALWEQNSSGGSSGGSSATYNVIYHSHTTPEQNKVYDAGIRPGNQVTVKAGNIFAAPTEKTFAGWSDKIGGSVVYKAGDTFSMPQQNVNLYAVWQDESQTPSPELETEPGSDGSANPGYGIPGTSILAPETPLSPLLNYTDHYAYIIGRDDGLVYPEGILTREEVAAIFFRLLKDEVRQQYLSSENTFPDVAESRWSNTVISTLVNAGILTGYPEGNFGPADPITRAEMAAIASRFEGLSPAETESFSDVSGHWAEAEIKYATWRGWVNGYPDGTFKPDQHITRAMAVALINRVLYRQVNSVDDLLPDMVQWSDNQNINAWYYFDIQEATNSHTFAWKDNGTHEHWLTLQQTPDWTKFQ